MNLAWDILARLPADELNRLSDEQIERKVRRRRQG
jgi:vacuolar-type H+-ATPase subunit B/Vma2